MEPESKKSTRRSFLKAGAGMIGTLGASPGLHSATAPDQPAHPRPNFVFILGEGHRPDTLSLNGNTILLTPNFDRIGREGIQFSNAFTPNALCLPARSVALTGLYTHTTGCIDNKNRSIPADIPLFTELLRNAGYAVGMFGKVHIAKLGERQWDSYSAFSSAETDYYSPVFDEGANGKVTPGQVSEGYVDDVITDKALAWLAQEREKPFCLCLWFQAPHAPFWRARRHMDLYNGVPIPKPVTFDDDLKGYPGKPQSFVNADNRIGPPYAAKHGKTPGSCPRTLEEVVKDFYAGVVDTDENTGRVFQALTDRGQLDDTVIVFTSDHGFFLGEWRMYDKRFMHEPSIRIPMLIRYPRLIRAGATSTEPVLLTDIAPTFLSLAGVEVPQPMHGQSLVPLLKGEEPKSWRKDWLYEYYESGGHNVPKNRGVRTERYKLIHYYEQPEEFELYDLQEDPGERHNLHGDPQYAALGRQLLQRIEELRKETGDH
jgi:arylsulfatase A-like enzyme